ncbi:hypothetical protein K438DRAFT_2041249, partial [Mycena galopus ATCC 62051]
PPRPPWPPNPSRPPPPRPPRSPSNPRPPKPPPKPPPPPLAPLGCENCTSLDLPPIRRRTRLLRAHDVLVELDVAKALRPPRVAVRGQPHTLSTALAEEASHRVLVDAETEIAHEQRRAWLARRFVAVRLCTVLPHLFLVRRVPVVDVHWPAVDLGPVQLQRSLDGGGGEVDVPGATGLVSGTVHGDRRRHELTTGRECLCKIFRVREM